MGAPPPLVAEEQEEDLSIGRAWRVQQLGWVVLALIVVAALAGLFGTGPLSWSRAVTTDGRLAVEYERFARNGGPVGLRLHVASSAAVDGQVRVEVSHELLDTLEVGQVTPEPAAQVSTPDGILFSFDSEGGAPLDVTISGTADTMGSSIGIVSVAGGPSVELRQFFYP